MDKKSYTCVKCGKTFETAPDDAGNVVCPHCHITFAAVRKDQTMKQNLLQPGTVIQGFEIIKRIGSGGMGTVYLATQKSMQRQIALKVLNPSVTKDAEAVEQFLKEVRNSGKLQHHNIVNAIDAGEIGGTYFLAMQYINGDTLDNIILKKGPLPEIRALEIVIQIAGALEYVWKKYKMFHRDIKPGNFMLNEDGEAMLMDMGIAQSIGDWHPEGSIEGSPYYMSPEQIRGEQLTWSTDLYSLGASLYQLVTGTTPFDAHTIDEILRMHCSSQVPEPTSRNPRCKVSPEVFELIKKMMSKKASDRFGSWEDFIKEAKRIHDRLKNPPKTVPKLINPATTAAFKATQAATQAAKTASFTKKVLPTEQEGSAAAAAAEALAKKREKFRKTLRKISIFGGILLIVLIAGGALAYFVLLDRNVSAAQEREQMLEAIFKKYQIDPDKSENLEKTLEEAESAVGKFGLGSEFRTSFREKIRMIRKQMNEFNRENKAFDSFAGDFQTDTGKIRNVITEQSAAGSPSMDAIRNAQGLVTILENNAKNQSPVSQKRQLQLQKLRESLPSLREQLKQCMERALQIEKQRADAEVNRRAQAEAARKSQAEAEARAELARKQAEDRQKAAAAEAAKRAAEEKAYENVILSKLTNAFSAMKKQYIENFAKGDLDAAEQYRIPEDVLKLETKSAKQSSELKKLRDSYDLYHGIAVKALSLWNAINDSSSSPFIKGLRVEKPFTGQQVPLDRIAGGMVYFKLGKPCPFLELTVRDRTEIMDKVASGANLQDARGAFCFTSGLFKRAYELLPQKERDEMIGFSKEYLKLQYDAAKKSNNLRVLQRLHRDFDNTPIGKEILKD